MKPLSRYKPLAALATWAGNHPKTVLVGSTLIPAFFKTSLFCHAYQREAFSDETKRMLVGQECLRQVVSSGLWLSSTIVGWTVSQKNLKSVAANNSLHLINANVVAQLVDTFVRPYLTAYMTARFFSKTTPTTQPHSLKLPMPHNQGTIIPPNFRAPQPIYRPVYPTGFRTGAMTRPMM